MISKLEYCYDASRDVILNIKHGLRAVAFEAHKEVPVRLDTIFGNREVKFPQFNNDILLSGGLMHGTISPYGERLLGPIA